MSLTTFSIFYFDYEVNRDNFYLNFNEGGGELTAEILIGSHTFTTLATAIQSALNTYGGLTYSVVANRSNRTYTISASGTFSLLVSTGSQVGNDVFSTIGFTGANRTGASSYTGAPAGKQYEPQFILQDHVSSNNSQQLIDSSVRTTITNKVEVVRFGIQKFVQMNIKFATNIPQDGKVIKSNPTGVESLQTFMQFCITKAPIEYMPNIGSRTTFEKLILERTPFNQNGTGYELDELYDRGLPNFFETGILRFKVVT